MNDYDELDKEAGNTMSSNDNTNRPKTGMRPRPGYARGRYMDLVHPNSDMRPPSMGYSTGGLKAPGSARPRPQQPAPAPEPEMEEEISEYDAPEFGVIEDIETTKIETEKNFVTEPEAMQNLSEMGQSAEYIEEEPNANNYSLGGQSPFIADAKVDKRPLGPYVPESAHSVHSTKNIYSQRTPTNQPIADMDHMVVGAPKKTSGWVWALVTILVVLVGGGLGFLAFMLYSS